MGLVRVCNIEQWFFFLFYLVSLKRFSVCFIQYICRFTEILTRCARYANSLFLSYYLYESTNVFIFIPHSYIAPLNYRPYQNIMQLLFDTFQTKSNCFNANWPIFEYTKLPIPRSEIMIHYLHFTHLIVIWVQSWTYTSYCLFNVTTKKKIKLDNSLTMLAINWCRNPILVH